MNKTGRKVGDDVDYDESVSLIGPFQDTRERDLIRMSETCLTA